jgi:hypothetical protein
MPRDALAEKPVYFRSTTCRQKPTEVDTYSRTISGFAVITKGEAQGHGLWIDDEFLAQVAAAMKDERGLKSRFTHPGLSSDGMGKYLGRAKNGYVDGDVVRGDLFVSDTSDKSPDGKLGEYVLSFAKEDPEAFGASIVFSRDTKTESLFMREHETEHEDEDGYRSRRFQSPDPENTRNLRHARLAVLRAVDIVDDPAANPGGMFSAGEEMATRAEMLLSFATGLSDSAPEEAFSGISGDRIKTFFEGFLERHGLELAAKEKAKTKEVSMAATIAELRAQFGSDPAFVLDQAEKGATMTEALSAWNKVERERLKAEREAFEKEKAELAAKATKAQSFGEPMVAFETPIVEPQQEMLDVGDVLPEDLGFKSAEAMEAYMLAAARGQITIKGF